LNGNANNGSMSAWHRRLCWGGLVVLFGLASWCAGAAQVSTQVDRNAVTLGDAITLWVVFEGLPPQDPPKLPDIPGFQFDASSTSRRQVFINGVTQEAFGLSLVPRTDGNLTIPSFSFKTGNQTFTTKPILIKVVRPSSSLPGPNPAAPLAFVTLYVPRLEVFVGEVFVIEARLFAPANRNPWLYPNWSPFEGSFRLTPLGGCYRTSLTTNNQSYEGQFWPAIATPLKTGLFTSGPVSVMIAFRQPGVFGQLQDVERHRLAADSLTLHVLPVPRTNMPPFFAGAVGTYSLNVSAAPTNVAAGDPVTVRIQLAGSGQFESLTLPAQPDWREFKTYPPTSTIVTNDRFGLNCTKTFEHVVIPQNHEIKSLPPFKFSFFDPEARTFRTLAGPAIPLVVRQTTNGGLPLPSLSGLTNREPQKDKPAEIGALKVHLGASSLARRPLFRRGWFWALQLAPPALWLGLSARRRWVESLARNPRLRRQREVARRMEEGLGQLKAAAAADQAEEFFATLFRLLQEQIGERLDLPASAITEAVIDEKLRPLGLAPAALRPIRDLFQECNLARYAAARNRAELGAIIPRFETVLESLRKLPDPGEEGR
jgi:hypothetical protein